MLHLHPVVGLVGQVVAAEQAGAAHYGQKAGMRHVGRPTGLTGLLPSKRQGLAAALC